MRFLFTCGGTAGHINPALGIAGRIRELLPESQFLFVGAEGNMETELVPREGYEIKTVTISNLHRSLKPKDIAHNMKAAANVIISSAQAKKIIREFKPAVAVGTGGYVCYPVLKMASKLKIPTAVHESNAVPGLTTKMLSGKVDHIMVGFKESREYYKFPGKVEITGTPVRGDFLKYTRSSARCALGMGDEPLVLSFWGSLGAAKMNEAMVEFIKCNCRDKKFKHIHATGGGDKGLERMKTMLAERGVQDFENTQLCPYIYDMPLLMAAADIILCRAGASTLSELAVLGKPAVLVPSPNVTNDHQTKNALVVYGRGGAEMIKESDITGEKLYNTVSEIVSDKQKLADMEKAMRSLGNHKATDKIADIILDMAKKH